MDFESEILKPHIIVLCHSEAWISAIRRNFVDARLSWVLGVDGLIEEAIQGQAVAAIIEFSPSHIVEMGKKLNRLANNSLNFRLFMVGDDGCLPWKPFLRAIDVANCYGSMLLIPDLVGAIQAHIRSTPRREPSIEEQVISALPWPAAAITDQA